MADLLIFLIGAIAKAPGFSGLSFTLNSSIFMIGNFINNLISFLIITVAIYLFVVMLFNSLMARIVLKTFLLNKKWKK